MDRDAHIRLAREVGRTSSPTRAPTPSGARLRAEAEAACARAIMVAHQYRVDGDQPPSQQGEPGASGSTREELDATRRELIELAEARGGEASGSLQVAGRSLGVRGRRSRSSSRRRSSCRCVSKLGSSTSVSSFLTCDRALEVATLNTRFASSRSSERVAVPRSQDARRRRLPRELRVPDGARSRRTRARPPARKPERSATKSSIAVRTPFRGPPSLRRGRG